MTHLHHDDESHNPHKDGRKGYVQIAVWKSAAFPGGFIDLDPAAIVQAAGTVATVDAVAECMKRLDTLERDAKLAKLGQKADNLDYELMQRMEKRIEALEKILREHCHGVDTGPHLVERAIQNTSAAKHPQWAINAPAQPAPRCAVCGQLILSFQNTRPTPDGRTAHAACTDQPKADTTVADETLRQIQEMAPKAPQPAPVAEKAKIVPPSKEWCEKAADMESGHVVAAGVPQDPPGDDAEVMACPFCGLTPTIEEYRGGPNTLTFASVGCKVCGINITGETRIGAVKYWNTRPERSLLVAIHKDELEKARTATAEHLATARAAEGEVVELADQIAALRAELASVRNLWNVDRSKLLALQTGGGTTDAQVLAERDLIVAKYDKLKKAYVDAMDRVPEDSPYDLRELVIKGREAVGTEERLVKALSDQASELEKVIKERDEAIEAHHEEHTLRSEMQAERDAAILRAEAADDQIASLRADLASALVRIHDARVPPIVQRMRDVAREHGWAIGVHGSLKRDIDLIAVPWTADATAPEMLIGALKRATGYEDKGHGMTDRRAGGRRSILLWHPDATFVQTEKGTWTPPAIDLSLMPSSAADLAAMTKRAEAAEKVVSPYADVCMERDAAKAETDELRDLLRILWTVRRPDRPKGTDDRIKAALEGKS